jgi:hypothetical protein
MASYRIEWKQSARKEIKHIERGTRNCSGNQRPYAKRGIGGCPRKVITRAG